MLTFRPVSLTDRSTVEHYMKRYPRRSLNYSFEVLYLWRESCEFEICEQGGFLLIKTFIHCNHNFLFPIGEGNLTEAIELMMAYATARKCSFNLFQLTAAERSEVDLLFPGRFRFEEQRNEMEYLYQRERLATLQGKKLQPKRNHINALSKEVDWQFEPITSENLTACIALNERWKLEQLELESEDVKMENEALANAFDDLFLLDLDGGALRISGEIVAFSIGCRLTEDCYLVLFEKADSNIRGAYPLINREFVTAFVDESITYINRGEDAGDEGLRKAKLSYYPDLMEPLYMVSESK